MKEIEIKKGFLKLPHNIGDKLICDKSLKLNEYRAISLIVRLTYGIYRGKQEWAILRNSDFKSVNISPNKIKDILDSLIEKEIIVFGGGYPSKYKLNESYFNNISDNKRLSTLISYHIEIYQKEQELIAQKDNGVIQIMNEFFDNSSKEEE